MYHHNYQETITHDLSGPGVTHELAETNNMVERHEVSYFVHQVQNKVKSIHLRFHTQDVNYVDELREEKTRDLK